jgi:hypothetical protein
MTSITEYGMGPNKKRQGEAQKDLQPSRAFDR